MQTKRQFIYIKNIPILSFAFFLGASTFATPSVATDKDQMAEWQQEIQNQIGKQFKDKYHPSNSPSVMTAERLDQIKIHVQKLATEDGAFKHHQIGQYCRDEVIILCAGKDLSDPSIAQCLRTKFEKLSKQCRTVMSDGYVAPPTKVDITFHKISIPTGSQHFYIPTDRSIGVRLSHPTNYFGVPIHKNITWYETGNIRSITPFQQPVRYGGILFAPDHPLEFLPNGHVRAGLVYQVENPNSHIFRSGQFIRRQSIKQPWQSQQ
ncbi:hypothetical protein AB4455_10255 [Vibrio sp. 10N.261.46.E12]|uniref:hypothetical protein n=1 Tax=unclassified Vibrio TaxID=2614977 RepID=UPI0009776D1F|nr:MULTISPECIES: hypothetical protein [unclassified Vibrio]OMO36153.1 hypothetical protein BH584_05095 [Vibrio sp. 10N.261.45.E1]PMJ34495.1 hypothetical protein BCU27_03440 [Vibrio sp. 10N.286.45.B6]PML88023.1 hypothetical protein BCT66_10510 [Vibrio sp. 10N.261.49.E11]PMM67350.1 hypothetical protein BCT48_14980 [Vibrio sp. 10N.261.46.F12]PMM81766.1 hypothetical protein BCT46_15275 [Vibrio sp. 10N.261.46.E8]